MKSNSFFMSNNDKTTPDSFEQDVIDTINSTIASINQQRFSYTVKHENDKKYYAPLEKNFWSEGVFKTVFSLGVWNMYRIILQKI